MTGQFLQIAPRIETAKTPRRAGFRRGGDGTREYFGKAGRRWGLTP
jgi:hypothetical protein